MGFDRMNVVGKMTVFCGLFVWSCGVAWGVVIEVGPGKRFAKIEEGYRASKPGDTVLVYPRAGGKAYEKAAIYVTKKRVHFQGVIEKQKGGNGKRVVISGKGFVYSGRGRTPRAIFQFNRGADGCIVEGFELREATNRSSNGAGVRINQANDVVVRNCEIHRCDMGIMSNGDGSMKYGVNQLIEKCVIHHNGNKRHAGYNHNLYLGGASVTMRFCEVYSPTTGHNYKSRAHSQLLAFNYIHHSTNRELDLVDAGETKHAGSHATLIGNVIVKDPKCRGNKSLMHFGQEGNGRPRGRLVFIHNTIVMPFVTGVTVTSPGAEVEFWGNVIYSPRRGGPQRLVTVSRGAKFSNIKGQGNWISDRYKDSVKKMAFGPTENVIERSPSRLFAKPDAADYRLAQPTDAMKRLKVNYGKIVMPQTAGTGKRISLDPGHAYKHSSESRRRTDVKAPTIGAMEIVQ